MMADVLEKNNIRELESRIHSKKITIEKQIQEMDDLKSKIENLTIACRVSTMGDIGSAFSHEINQPLTAINAYGRSCLSILKSQSNPEVICNRLRFPLEQLIVQAEHAGRIVENMMRFVRDCGFHAEETDMNRLIKDTLSMFDSERMDFKFKITLHLMDGLPRMMSNKIYMMQIMLNLLRNSMEALRDANTTEPELTIETRLLNGNIVVSITDNGPGVPIEIQDKVLNAYFTTKREGTGMGLGICRSLIEAHGGTLSVDKDIKKGACFSFTLPAKKII